MRPYREKKTNATVSMKSVSLETRAQKIKTW